MVVKLHGTIAPDTAPADKMPRGTNQSGMRAYNEKLILTLIRRNGSLAKSDISRMTGLSAQTISVIVRRLETDKLIRRGEPVRGRIGQPSVPMSLNPEGAYFFGLKIGRRSAELVLLDFLGRPVEHRRTTYPWPELAHVSSFALKAIEEIESSVSRAQRQAISGLGIAMPFELWNWTDTVGAPTGVMDSWRTVDIRCLIGDRVDYPVFVENDASAACAAELVFGIGQTRRDFLYFFVGSFIGGGIVLDGNLYSGPGGNAGALGSVLVTDRHSRVRQLIDVASIHTLEEELDAAGLDASMLWTSPENWGDLGNQLDQWLDAAGDAIAQSVVSSVAILDTDLIVVEGWMPEPVRARLVAIIRARLLKFDAEGITLPEIVEGTVGMGARAVGGATLPLASRFMITQDTVTGRAA